MNCIIVDDDETSRLVLTNLISKIEGLNLIKACKNTTEAREVMRNVTLDLLFLDIEMPKETGVEFFDTLTTKTDVVFITSQAKHAVKAFESDAVDYLLKPVNLERLNQAVDKAKRRVKNEKEEQNLSGNDSYFFVKTKDQLEKIFYRNIKYIESSSGYVTFYNIKKNILVNGTLKRVEEKLDNKQFIRVHRSYIINLNRISGYGNDFIEIDSTKVPLSRLYKKEVVDILEKLTI